MTTSKPIPIRLPTEWVDRYTEAAARAGLPLSTYLRRRLMSDDQSLEALAGIRAAMDRLAAAQVVSKDRNEGGGQGGADDVSINLEVLLLLRMLAGQSRLDMVQAELRRQGVTPVSF